MYSWKNFGFEGRKPLVTFLYTRFPWTSLVLPNFWTLTSTNGLPPLLSRMHLFDDVYSACFVAVYACAFDSQNIVRFSFRKLKRHSPQSRGMSSVNSRNRKMIVQHALPTRHVIGSRVHGRRNGIAKVCRLVPLGPSIFGGRFFSISVLYRRSRGPMTFIMVCARRYQYGNITNPLPHIRW